MVYWYNGMPHSDKKEQINDTHKNMDESISQALQWIKEDIHKKVSEGEICYPNMKNMSSTWVYYRISLNKRCYLLFFLFLAATTLSFHFISRYSVLGRSTGGMVTEKPIENILGTRKFREFVFYKVV